MHYLTFRIAAALVNLAPQIMYILVPNHTSNEVINLQISMIIYGIYSMNALEYYILLATGVKTCSVILAMGSILSILLIYICSRAFGLIGAITGNSGYMLTLVMVIIGMKNL
jgi:hypothetical protein